MNKVKVDYVIIGAGSGGLTLASGLRKLGKNYRIISKNIGGDCTNYGCIPSKTFLKYAKEFESTKDASIKNDVFKKITDQVDKTLKKEKDNYVDSNFIFGEAKFLSKNSIQVVTETQTSAIEFNHAIIATGSSPAELEIDGLSSEKIYTNKTIFNLESIPSSITIIGGGPIGIEMAEAFASFGSKVNIVDSKRAVSFEPEKLAQEIKDKLQKKGVSFIENAKAYAFKDKSLLLKTESGEELKIDESEIYLLAIGRTPNTNLDLEKAHVKYDKDGIETNQNLFTSNKKIFAIGDVTKNPRFTHVANEHAKFIITHIAAPIITRHDAPIPRVTFSNPPIASVGETTESSLVKSFSIDFTKTDRSEIEDSQTAKAEIFIHMITGKIFGASIIGEFSEHIINVFTLLVKEHISIWKLRDFITPYPTLFNGFDSLYIEYIYAFRDKLVSNIFTLFKQNLGRIVTVVAYLVVILLGLQFLSTFDYDFIAVLDFMRDILLSPIGFLLYVGLYAFNTHILFSASLLSVLSGQVLGFSSGLIYVIITSNVAAAVSYFLGKTIFSSTKNKKSRFSIIRTIQNHPFKSVLIARLTYIPFDIVGYIAGSVQISFKKFMLATVIGTIPGILVNVSIGASLSGSTSLSDIEFNPTLIGISLSVSAIMIALSFFLKEKHA